MTPRRRILRTFRGDATPFTFKVTSIDPDGNPAPIDITGSTFVFTAKVREDDASPLFSRNGVITDALNGEAEVRLAAANTAGLTVPTTVYYDLQMTDAQNDPHTIDAGYLLIEPDITT